MARYVRTVVDMTSGASIAGTVAFSPMTDPPPLQMEQVLVVHDSAGDVVVRAYHATGPYVIGRAAWNPSTTSLDDQRGINPTTPSAAQWQIVARVLAEVVPLANARYDYPSEDDMQAAPWRDTEHLHPDDTPHGQHMKELRDRAMDPTPVKPGSGRSFSDRHKIIAGIGLTVLVLGGIGAYEYVHYRWHKLTTPQGSVGNGGECYHDYDCRSGYCDVRTCAALERRRGDACTLDKQCASHSCRITDVNHGAFCD